MNVDHFTLPEAMAEIARVRAALGIDAIAAEGVVRSARAIPRNARAMYLLGNAMLIVGRDLVAAALGRDTAAEFFRAALAHAEAAEGEAETRVQ